MEMSAIISDKIKHITLKEFEECKRRASTEKKFRFGPGWGSFSLVCDICEKVTNRYGYECTSKQTYVCCSSCARKIARGVLLSITMKKLVSKEYSRGVRYGYTLTRQSTHAEETIKFIRAIIEDAKKEGKTVHFLGRDMDVLFVCFNLEDNVNYFKGWNRNFSYQDITPKQKLLVQNNIQEGDFVVDTGFAGSILDSISEHVNIRGYLLSASAENKYPHLYDGNNYNYREWVCSIEHLDRAREVSIDQETLISEERFVRPSWYESGVFHGFVRGAIHF